MYLHIYQPGVAGGAQCRATDPCPPSGWIVAFETPEFHLLKEMQNWCRTTYGEKSVLRWRDEIRWGEVWFRDEADTMLFQLRWA
jgi:hypothetical protein